MIRCVTAELLLTIRFHTIPVVEDSRLIGFVTYFDLLRYAF